MNSIEIIVKKLKAAIAKLKNQVKIGVKNARKYIIALIDVENKLAAIEAAVAPAPIKSTPVARSTPIQLNLIDFLNQQPKCEVAMSINLSNTGKFSQEWKSAMNRQDEYFNNLCAKKSLRDWSKEEIAEYDRLEAETVFWAKKMHSEPVPVASVDPKVQADDDKYAKSRGYSNMNEMIGRF